MARRRYYRRSRQRYTSHDLQEALKKKTSPLLTINNPAKTTDENGGSLLPETTKTEQRSPESVLFGSQKSEMPRCDDLSPEIVPEKLLSRMKLQLDRIEANVDYETEDLEIEKLITTRTKGNDDPATTGNFLMEKTLSINDEIKLEMNGYDLTDESKSLQRSGIGNITDFRSSTQQTFHQNDEPESFAGLQLFLDESRSAGRSKESSEKRREAGKGKNASRFATNWSECRRIFSNLRQLNTFRIRNEPVSGWFPKYIVFNHDTQSSQNSYSPSSCSLLDRNSRDSKCYLTKGSNALDGSEDRKDYRDKGGTRIRARSTTPCSGSPPPAKRCRTTLNFDDGEKFEDLERLGQEHKITDFLKAERKNPGENSFCPIYTKTEEWNGSGLDSSRVSVLDLPAVSDSGQSGLEIDREPGTQDNSYTDFLKNHRRRRFRFSNWPMSGVSIFCVWMMKRLANLLKKTSKKLRRTVTLYAKSKNTDRVEELGEVITSLRKENEQMIRMLLEKVERLSDELTQTRMNTETALGTLTTEIGDIRVASKKIAENNEALTQELKKLHGTLEDVRTRSCKPPPPPPPPPLPPPPPPPTLASSLDFRSPLQPVTPTTPSRTGKTPSRKCSTPLLNRPTITVEDLLKVTLKKAPQNNKENRRNTIPGPRGPVVSLDMLRNVKLKCARRRTTEQNLKSPRSPRLIKTRTAPSLSLSPIMSVADTSLGRILRQVDLNRRGPRRLLSTSAGSRETEFGQDNHSRSTDAAKEANLQSTIA